MDERKHAISFANSYFALVDGLASGLENHLSDDVVLDWFGRMVKGRKNVSAFMEAHKVASRHRFPRILPTTGIHYKTKRSERKQFPADRQCLETSENAVYGKSEGNGEPVLQKTKTSAVREAIIDFNRNEIDAKEISVTDETSYDLSEGDLSNLFKLEISSTDVEEIEQSINRMKLEEEMVPSIKLINRENGQGDSPVVVETSAIKYVEADGEIEFSRKFSKRGGWNAYISATWNVHTWRRPCKLQIAYSTFIERPTLQSSCKSPNTAVPFGQPKVKLPSFEEINEITNRIVPNTNEFAGFLKDSDFFEDRKGFLESLEMELTTKDPCTPIFAPHYVQDKLVFDKPCVDVTDCSGRSKKKFLFNYQIHLIIYEGRNRCKMNLAQDFERANI